MTASNTPNKLGMLERSFELNRASMNEEKRTVKVKFASETPVQRWYGTEILDCSPSAVRTERVKAGAAVLLEHSAMRRVGITEGCDFSGGEGTAEIRFARTASGEEAFNEVKDGTLRWVSVGYRVHKYEEKNPDSENPEYRATDWEPMEISLVGIPADPTARVMRSGNDEQWPVEIRSERKEMKIQYNQAPTDGGGGSSDNSAAILTARNSEKGRLKAILSAAQKFRSKVPTAMEEAQRAIESDMSPASFNDWILDQMNTEAPKERAADAPAPKDENRSLGEIFADRLANPGGGLQGIIGRNVRELMVKRTVEIPLQTRATLTTTVAGLTKYERPPGMVMVEQQPLLVADLFAPGMTEQTTIRYLREDTFTNAATALAEEGTFQEMSWDLSEQDAAIRKVGVIARATDEILADSSTISSYFNARIPFAVAQLQDQHLVDGTGLSNQITGILATSNIQTEASGASPSVVDAIFKAITKVRSVGFYEPDAVLIHPTDYQNYRLAKDGNGQYLAGGPVYGPYGQGAFSNVAPIWGLRAVITTAIDQGTALVGAFRIGAQLWMRAGMTVDVSNSDASDFANGRIAIRAYIRHGLAVYRPTAFCTVTGIPA
jgi:phage head maturation protease